MQRKKGHYKSQFLNSYYFWVSYSWFNLSKDIQWLLGEIFVMFLLIFNRKGKGERRSREIDQLLPACRLLRIEPTTLGMCPWKGTQLHSILDFGNFCILFPWLVFLMFNIINYIFKELYFLLYMFVFYFINLCYLFIFCFFGLNALYLTWDVLTWDVYLNNWFSALFFG